jgi:hypothetical protein
MKRLTTTTTHFLAEGRANLPECLRISFERAVTTQIKTIVMFTVNGDGLEIACDKFLTEPRYQDTRVIGVSFPIGTAPPAVLTVPESRAHLLDKFRIPILRAANPLGDPLNPSGRNIVHKTLEIFSGGMALCVWGILVACDMGAIDSGEHVISCCADTSIIAKAAPSAHFLSSFAVREVICISLIHDISKRESIAEELNVEAFTSGTKRRPAKRLPQATKH